MEKKLTYEEQHQRDMEVMREKSKALDETFKKIEGLFPLVNEIATNEELQKVKQHKIYE